MAPRTKTPKESAAPDPELEHDGENEFPEGDSEEGDEGAEDDDESSDFANADDTAAPDDATDDVGSLTPEQRAAVYLLGEGGKDQSRFKVNNQEPGYEYFHFMPGEMNDGERERQRDRLFRKGFEPVNYNPDTDEAIEADEYVPAAPGAEIWKIKKSIAKRYKAQRLEKALDSPLWLQAQAGRVQRNAILNTTLREAKKARMQTPARIPEPKGKSMKQRLFGNAKRGEGQRLADAARNMRERVKSFAE